MVSHGLIPETPTAPEYAGFIDGMRHVAMHLKPGQNLLFETGRTPVAMLRCFEDIGLDNLYVNLDPANLILYGKANPVDALDVWHICAACTPRTACTPPMAASWARK